MLQSHLQPSDSPFDKVDIFLLPHGFCEANFTLVHELAGLDRRIPITGPRIAWYLRAEDNCQILCAGEYRQADEPEFHIRIRKPGQSKMGPSELSFRMRNTGVPALDQADFSAPESIESIKNHMVEFFTDERFFPHTPKTRPTRAKAPENTRR